MAFAAPSAAAAPASEPFEYLYVDANEDNASGGHVAVRLGDDVFHFQYEDALLRIHQDRWPDFDVRYRGLQNRNIQATRIAVSDDSFARLRRGFRHRFMSDSRQFALLGAARADAVAAQSLASGRALPAPGLGFFPDTRAQRSTSPWHGHLREAIAQRYGAEYLSERAGQLRRDLESLDVRGVEATPADFEAGRFPQPHYAFHERYADGVAALHALAVLERGIPLAADRLRWLPGPTGALRPEESRGLERALRDQSERLVRLARASRPDWGTAWLLGMARLEAMQRSLDAGRWALLDALPRDAQRITVTRRQRAWLPELEAEAGRDLERERHAFGRSDDGGGEKRYARLEARASRWLELRQARQGAKTLRLHPGPLVPQAPGTPVSPIVPAAIAADPDAVVHELSEHSRRVEALASASLGYDLTQRNCVSELFAAIDRVLAEVAVEQFGSADVASLHSVERERFGGVLPDSIGAGVIPFASALQVQSHWRVASTRSLPSLRRARVDAMREREGVLRVGLRESNAFTAQAYEPGERDSIFLFFTDQAGASRPLLGAGNLLFALAGSAVGVLSLPVDRGETLGRALRGALFSVPELAFQNIRKGTNEWVPPAWRQLLEGGRE